MKRRPEWEKRAKKHPRYWHLGRRATPPDYRDPYLIEAFVQQTLERICRRSGLPDDDIDVLYAAWRVERNITRKDPLAVRWMGGKFSYERWCHRNRVTPAQFLSNDEE